MAVGTGSVAVLVYVVQCAQLLLMAATAPFFVSLPGMWAVAVAAARVLERQAGACPCELRVVAVAAAAGATGERLVTVRWVARLAGPVSFRRWLRSQVYTVAAIAGLAPKPACGGISVQPVTDIATRLRVERGGFDAECRRFARAARLGAGVAAHALGDDSLPLFVRRSLEAVTPDTHLSLPDLVDILLMERHLVTVQADRGGQPCALVEAFAVTRKAGRLLRVFVHAVSRGASGGSPRGVVDPVVAGAAGRVCDLSVGGHAEALPHRGCPERKAEPRLVALLTFDSRVLSDRFGAQAGVKVTPRRTEVGLVSYSRGGLGEHGVEGHQPDQRGYGDTSLDGARRLPGSAYGAWK